MARKAKPTGNGNGKQLRFAKLIRVSTDRQEDKGESLKNQSRDIDSAAQSVGGKVVETYGGSEHGTPGWEKKEVDRLLRDAALNKWDAVMVYNEWRWSRDNVANETGLDLLRDNGKRFFVLTKEWDLYSPHDRYTLANFATIGKLTAQSQARESIKSRIARAQRHIPTAGNLPYARTFDKDKLAAGVAPAKCWGLDKAKHTIIKDCAKRYLAGESASKLAREYGMNQSYLLFIFRERCGDKWIEEFSEPRFNIHEEVEHTVPRLLPEATIKAIAKQAAKNRTSNHRTNPDRQYLLSGYIYCEHCGYMMAGNTNVKTSSRSEKMYYRHSRHTKHTCTCKPGFVALDDLDDYVVMKLLGLFGDVDKLERAVKAAIPNPGEIDQLREQEAQLAAKQKQLEAKKQKLIDGYSADEPLFTKEEVAPKLAQIREQESALADKLAAIRAKLANVPSGKEVRTLSADVIKALNDCLYPTRRRDRKIPAINYDTGEVDEDGEPAIGLNIRMELLSENYTPEYIEKMPFAAKRKLIETVFSGSCPDGKPAGVYIQWDQENFTRPRQWTYKIRGLIRPEPGKRFKSRPKRTGSNDAWRSPLADHPP